MRKAVIGLLISLSLTSSLLACPNCKEQISHSDAQEAQAVPAAFNYSIYSMLGGLFLTTAIFGRFVYKAIRDTDRRAR